MHTLNNLFEYLVWSHNWQFLHHAANIVAHWSNKQNGHKNIINTITTIYTTICAFKLLKGGPTLHFYLWYFNYHWSIIHTFILNERTNTYFILMQEVCSNYDFIFKPSMIYYSLIFDMRNKKLRWSFKLLFFNSRVVNQDNQIDRLIQFVMS